MLPVGQSFFKDTNLSRYEFLCQYLTLEKKIFKSFPTFILIQILEFSYLPTVTLLIE